MTQQEKLARAIVARVLDMVDQTMLVADMEDEVGELVDGYFKKQNDKIADLQSKLTALRRKK